MTDDANKKTIAVLNELIETCKDGAQGFTTASEDAKDASLKSTFGKYATQRAAFATELDGLVTGLRGDAADSGHIAGVVHRGWINLKAALSGNDDKAILNECERGEDYAKKAYTDALKENLPATVRAVVERQASDVKDAHDRVRDLRNAANAAADTASHLETVERSEPVYHE